MIEVVGKYGKAKVMIDSVDQATMTQIYQFLNHEAFTENIAIMPDTHAGAGAVIGFTMPMNDKIIPNVVGVDINCGMLSMRFKNSVLMHAKKRYIDRQIRQEIPFGTSVRKTAKLDFFNEAALRHITVDGSIFTEKYNERYGTKHSPVEYTVEWFENKCKEINIDYDRALKSVGTLGGGNHFIEIGQSVNTKESWVTVHSGSRQFGLKIALYWQKRAGKGALAYLQGDEMFGYLSDMFFAQKYAETNRKTMGNIIKSMFGEVTEEIQTPHNFIGEDFIIRKGAVPSYKNETMIIPFNMEDGILICTGKSNPEWNYSAPHGAGRISSRSKAKKKNKRTESDIEKRMHDKGIYFSKLPLDEVKEAYKDPKIIEDAIGPTADIIDRIKPILVMKE